MIDAHQLYHDAPWRYGVTPFWRFEMISADYARKSNVGAEIFVLGNPDGAMRRFQITFRNGGK